MPAQEECREAAEECAGPKGTFAHSREALSLVCGAIGRVPTSGHLRTAAQEQWGVRVVVDRRGALFLLSRHGGAPCSALEISGYDARWQFPTLDSVPRLTGPSLSFPVCHASWRSRCCRAVKAFGVLSFSAAFVLAGVAALVASERIPRMIVRRVRAGLLDLVRLDSVADFDADFGSRNATYVCSVWGGGRRDRR